MKKIELLAPAGNLESVYAAVQSGANAVYLGGSRFSARAYADNFDDEIMKKTVDYCHLYDVKIYVTVNTIIKEKEIKDAVSYAGFLYDVGVDALIVQDIGFAVLVKKYFPNFKLHASTQMTVHNLETALFLESIGFDRIVLSRELSLKEIESISKILNMDIEVFVHGALCVCYSGQCLMSSMIGGRSGNRGKCAQPCRLPYSIVKEMDDSSKKGYLLSPKDMCTIENIGDILRTGACSLKIEGRMKRPEYVAGVVREYRKAIDSFLNDGIEKIPKTESIRKLLQLF
ncbi:peptidase U32 family protein, partial [Clostridium sp.]